MIKVVRGNPTPEELAAALAVVRARATETGADSGAPRPPSAWNTPARVARRSLPQPGPASWARTYWPS
jgi:hypothetical protein